MSIYEQSNLILEQIIDRYPDESFLKTDGFDEAIIGLEESSMKLIYSVSKCIAILLKHMSIEEALEHFDFNVRGAYVGDKTPIWCEDNFDL
jgi:hypothetical protein